MWTAAVCLLLVLTLSGDRALAAPAWDAAACAGSVEIGDTVIPLGRAVGIKLFSDGVVVTGLWSPPAALCPPDEPAVCEQGM